MSAAKNLFQRGAMAAGARMDRTLTRWFTVPSITWREAFAILLPLMGEQIATSLFGLLNTGMISASGASSLSAVSLVNTLNNFLYVFYLGMSTGASVVIANYRGLRDEAKLHEASVQAVTTVTTTAALITLVAVLFNGPMLRLVYGAAEKDVMDQARLYILGTAATLPIIGVTTATCGVLRGIGEGKTSMIYVVLTQMKYVALNVLFIRVLGMGVRGLILSITCSRLLDLGILWFLLKRRHSRFVFRFREFFHFNFPIIRSMLVVGIPYIMEQLFFTGGRVVTQATIVPMGTASIAAYNISYSLMIFSQLLSNAICTSMYTITGICIGNRREQDVRGLAKHYLVLNSLLYALMLGVMLLLFDRLAHFYNPPEEVVPLIFACMLSSCLVQPFIHSAAFMLPNVLRAAGDGNYCTIGSLLIMWIFRVGGGYVLGRTLGFGVYGVWAAMLIDWVVRAVYFPLRFRGDRWLRHKVLKDEA